MRRMLELAYTSAPAMIVVAIALGVVSGGTQALAVALTHRAMETALPSHALVLGFGVVALCMLLSRALALSVMNRFPPRTLHALRLRIAEQVLESPLARIEESGAGTILSVLTQEVTVISEGLFMLPGAIVIVVTVLGCLVYIATLSWMLFACIIPLVLLSALLSRVMAHRSQRFYAQTLDAQARLFSSFQALVRGQKELQLNPELRTSFHAALAEDSSRFTASSIEGTSRLIHSNVGTEAGSQILILFVAFLSPYLMHDAAVYVRSGSAFVLLLVFAQLQILTTMILPRITFAARALDRFAALQLSLPRGASEPVVVSRSGETLTSLELRGVTHSYRHENSDREFLLGPVDLTLRPGEIVFLVGSNGSGKSTLLKVLTGLYLPGAGSIHVDGEPIDPVADRDRYRSLFSAVFAEPQLFDMLPAGTDLARAASYLAAFKLDHKVRIEGGRLSTLELSQGQRKRLALLVAYLQDCPVFVFDEWAADQDPVFKKVFYEQLLPELAASGKVVFVISHDDQFFSGADRIVRLDEGKVREPEHTESESP